MRDFCVAEQLLRWLVMNCQVHLRRPAMFLRCVMLAATVAITVPAFAQDAQDEPPPAPPSEQRQAVPRGSRPQGDNPRTGTAVPRREVPGPAPAPDTSAPAVRSRAAERGRENERARGLVNRGNTVIVNPPPVYNYNYPRRSTRTATARSGWATSTTTRIAGIRGTRLWLRLRLRLLAAIRLRFRF